MWYVYIIQSVDFPEQEYIGATSNLKRRLPEHNAGKSATPQSSNLGNCSGTAPFQTR
jgi:predicted GIY-YIG superfamily endonuclease